MNSVIHLFLLVFLGSVLGLIGGILFLYNKKLSAVLEKNSISFASGVLMTVSLLGLLPESMELIGAPALWIVLLSFFGAYFCEHFLLDIHHHEEKHTNKTNFSSSVPLVIFGDTIHNFVDGVAIGGSFAINSGLGFVTAFSTFLHEVPHEVGDFGIMLKAGWKRRDIVVVNILSSFATLLGAFFTFFLFSESNSFTGILLAFSAGIFLYLGTIDFLPHAADGFNNRFKAILPLMLGVIAMILTLYMIPHSQ